MIWDTHPTFVFVQSSQDNPRIWVVTKTKFKVISDWQTTGIDVIVFILNIELINYFECHANSIKQNRYVLSILKKVTVYYIYIN